MRESIIWACALLGAGLSSVAQSAVIIDFETDFNNDPIVAGQVIDTEFTHLGVSLVTAENYRFGHPDLAAIFDSSNPTGGDDDLQTPGVHPTNTVAYGNILIIPESGDNDNDGIIDDPDDEKANPAGWIDFALSGVYTGFKAIMIDTEEPTGTVDFYLGGLFQGSVPLPAVDDNEVYMVTYNQTPYDQFRFNFAGSGGIAQIELIPEPASIALLAFGAMPLLLRRRQSA